ncbi:zinc finger protein 32-like [Bombus pascuorum]|uniref:zinc finger protein 32-like n=1 Tax=Bombus pascuorum TaxID=65598 RepID=UPI00298E6983|nr:zinc finger protein 32-like [Bombus pascuorum]
MYPTFITAGHFKETGTFPCWYRLPIGFETYPCDTCGRQYRRVISLQRHKRLECGKEAQFECVICHSKFKHKHSLLRHYNVHVADVKKSSNSEREQRSVIGCNFIQKTKIRSRYSNQYQQRHLRVECGQAPKYQCKICHGWFKYKHNLTAHWKLHVEEPKHNCDLCPKKFYRRDRLLEHQKRLHNLLHMLLNLTKESNISMQARGAVRWKLAVVQVTPYQCPKCFKYFKSSKSCCNHRSTCGTDKKFRCAFCDYRSHQKGNVLRHLATQHPEAGQKKRVNCVLKTNDCEKIALSSNVKYK